MGEAKRKYNLANRTFVDVDDLETHASYIVSDFILKSGRLIYRAQLLDLMFRIIHVLLDAKRDGRLSKDIYEWLDPKNTLTMGEVYSELLKRRYLFPWQKNKLKLAITERNLLAHGWLPGKPLKTLLLTPNDRATLIRRVEGAFRRIHQATIALVEIGRTITSKDSNLVWISLSGRVESLIAPPEKEMKPIYSLLALAQVEYQILELMLRSSLISSCHPSKATNSLESHPASEMPILQVISNLKDNGVFDEQQIARIREAVFARNKIVHFPWFSVGGVVADQEIEEHFRQIVSSIADTNKYIVSYLSP